jgi:G3E family GTPase
MTDGLVAPASRAAATAIPLTVIGGFLGAGKTTLVNSILAQSEARSLAVLVNDFGDLSIDGALISSRGARTISLTNGCVCCTLVGGLAQALIDVLELDPPPDHVLVEASGVSDPRRIAQIARADRRFAEDATVVVAAADQIQMLAGDRYVGDTVRRQLEQASLIVFNKRDLVGEAQAQGTLRWLRTISPGVQIIEAVNAGLPCDVVLGPATRNLVTSDRISGGVFERTFAREHGGHGQAFTARTFRSSEPLAEGELRRALDVLPDAVLRAKGLVRFDTAPEIQQLVQAVGRRWAISIAPAGAAAARSLLVIIAATDALGTADLSELEDVFSRTADSR